MARYRVAQVGVGARGRIHADGFLKNPDRFDLVALCDLNEDRLREAAEQFGVAATYTDADTMLAETRPDVFCFVTQPDVRLSMVELAARHGVRGLAFEKPMATSLREAWAIAELCRHHHIKAVVSHQQKYLTSMQAMKAVVDAGHVGEVYLIHCTCQAWLSQLGTHFMDYMLWANNGARGQWAIGHVHGKGRLDDSHPSPDHLLGQVCFENGVRGILECGTCAPEHLRASGLFWVDNRIWAYGTHGYAWADTNGRWGAFTRATGGQTAGEQGDTWGVQQATRLQPLYLRDLADWLDDDAKVHSCNVALAYHGYEILEAMCLAALDHRRVDLPLADPAASADLLARMRRELPDVPPLEP